MASTRNLNSKGDYGLEQKYYALGRNYQNYQYSQVGQAFRPALPDIGYMPSHMPRSNFAHNSVDIESMLYGINSTNLVTPQKPIKPELKTLPTMAFFDRLPVHMPKPLVVENNQRPYPV